MATKQQLEKAVFGEGSDLSSEDEDDYRGGTVKKGNAPARDGSSGDSGEERQNRLAKPKKRKAKAVEGEGPPRKRKKRKPSPPQEEAELPELSPEEARRMKLDKAIKEVLKPAKRAKKRTKANEDDLDQAADAYIQKLRDRMHGAAAKDKDCYANNQPAPYKLAMLDEVMDAMQKRQYTSSIMDQNLLSACKVWLEPLDAKSLPTLNIQRAFFEQFTKMNIDTETLRESGLGRIVLFYTKCKRVTQPIQRIASQLVEEWSRPILKRSASYRDRFIPVASQEDIEGLRTVQLPKLNAILNKAREETDPARSKRHSASVPERTLMTFTVAPKMHSSLLQRNPHDDALAARRSNKELLKRLQKTSNGRGSRA